MAAREFWSRLSHVRRSLVVTAVTIAVVGTVPALTQTAAHAAGTGTGVGYTLEGCRANATVYPVLGPFICADAQYTTGNLGSGWNEFDLVPGRVTLTSGSSSPGTFAFLVSVDRCSDTSNPCTATPGYDRLSTLTLNTNPGQSSGTCGSPTIGSATVSGNPASSRAWEKG